MSLIKLGLAAIVSSVGFTGIAQAQYPATRPIAPGSNFNSGFAGTYGVPGTYSNYGYTGRSPYYAPYRYSVAPQTYNNMGGLIGTIQRQTGRPGSYRNGPAYGVSRKRPKP